jgi:hypothetical protein
MPTYHQLKKSILVSRRLGREFWHFKLPHQPVMPLNYSKMIPEHTPIESLSRQHYPDLSGRSRHKLFVRTEQDIAKMVSEVLRRKGWRA